MFNTIARQIERGMRPLVTVDTGEALMIIEALRKHGGDRHKKLATNLARRLRR